ncbi:hypothetical protein GCM10010430_23100 [Kitasatospora cystarginea]|uniref:HTH araC/xylS-type domain-containing protein n=1 Tax=Kitasatospora cystarginea TaxID=58350 RepID=A0ABN3DSW8_9ACTN
MPTPATRLPRLPQAGLPTAVPRSTNVAQSAKPYYGPHGPLASRPGITTSANPSAGQAGYPATTAPQYSTTGPLADLASEGGAPLVPGSGAGHFPVQLAGHAGGQHGPTVGIATATGAASTASMVATAAAAAAGSAGAVGAAGSAGSSSTVLASAPRKLSGRRRRETVAVLIFGGAPIFESSIPLSVFGVDRQDAGVPRYRLLVCAGEDGPLATTGGLTLTAPYGLEALARAGTIVVPAWRSISQPPPVEAIAALRKAHHEGARIIGLCTGAFVLAAAGLLDGRPATTHWMYAPTLAKRYPRVHVDPRELFVDDGDVLTSAGTAAGIDLCLHVVRTDHGAEAANALARRLVVPSRRSGGGQAQYIDQSLPEEIGNDPLAEVVTWALENLNQQFDVEVLAARAYMSRRTFDRRFRTLTGSAPLQWLITQRVLQAQRLLETSELSVDDVARRCGFRSPVALRGHFRRQLGVSPAAYRTSYRARRPASGGATVPPQGHPAQGHGHHAPGHPAASGYPAERLSGLAGATGPLGAASAPAGMPAGAPGAAGPAGGAPGAGFGAQAGATGTAVAGSQAGVGPAGGTSPAGAAAGAPPAYHSPGAPGAGGSPTAGALGRGRFRPGVPPQPGTGLGRTSRPGDRPTERQERPARPVRQADQLTDRLADRSPERAVEHAAAADEAHGRPSARGLGQRHRADGSALPHAHASGAPAPGRPGVGDHPGSGFADDDSDGARTGGPGVEHHKVDDAVHEADRAEDPADGSADTGGTARLPEADRQLSGSRDRAVG